jgi:hypothetical protein
MHDYVHSGRVHVFQQGNVDGVKRSEGWRSTGHGVFSARAARAYQTGIALSRAVRSRKLPLARHNDTSSTLPVRQHIAAIATPDVSGRVLIDGRQLGFQVWKRDAVPYPLGRARPLFSSICGYATFTDWTASAPIKDTAATIVNCQNATNQFVPRYFIHH